VAYRADIEIAVKGQAAVNKLQRDLDTLGQKIDAIAKRRVGPSNALETFNAQLREARQRLNEVVAGTTLETAAIKNYVTALGNANAAGERQNNLIANEIRLRESATNQLEKLTQRQAEFTARTNDAAQAAHRQTAEFLRQKRVALEVAKINEAAPTAQLLLAPAAPGAPAMSGGARRRITGAVERLGGARVEDEAARALRFAQASGEQIRPLSQIQSLFAGIAGEAAKLQRIKALPDSRMLNASVRGIQQLEKAEDFLNRERQESATRLKEIDRLEEGRLRRARKLQARQQYMDGETTQTTRARGGNGRVGGAISSALIGGGFPLLFGQGPSAAAGGALGGVAGGLLGGGFGFALSIVGTALGDIITKSEAFDKSLATLNTGLSTTGSTSITTANDVSKLASSLNVTKEEAIELVNTFKQFKDGDTREALAGLFGPVGGAPTFEAIAKAGVDEKNALAAIFSLRKEIGNDAALQLALQLKSVGASTTQASLLKIILDRSIEISVAQASQVEFTDILLSIWEGIVAGVAQALSLATRFIAKMQEGSLIKLPFLDKIIAALGGVEGRTPKEIADQRGQDVAAQLKAERDRIRKALAQETEVAGTESALGEALKTGKTDAQRAAEEAARIEKQTQERLRALTREVELTRQIGTVKELQFRAEMDGNKELQIRLQGEERIIRIMQATSQALDGITDKRLRQAELSKAANNIDAARQETLFEMERLDSERTKSFDAIIADLNLELELKTATTEQAREQLRLEAEIAKIRKDPSLSDPQKTDIERRKRENARPLTEGQKINAELGAVEDELKTLVSLSNQVTSAANAIGTAFGDSFKGLISGSMTAKEALASFFSSVADHFLDMAAQIIAKMIQMFILQQALKIFGGALGGGGGFGAGGAGFGGSNAFSSFDAGGAAAFGMPSLMAQGGFVTGPTSAIIGEGGESEYVIPASKMSAAMSRYSRGARGEGVIAGSGGDTSEAGGNATPVNGAIDVRYTVERINDVEYVTASQFQAGMRQAAQQGAAQGEQRTLRKLQMSSSTRRRVGV
jgi:hypothetical protein